MQSVRESLKELPKILEIVLVHALILFPLFVGFVRVTLIRQLVGCLRLHHVYVILQLLIESVPRDLNVKLGSGWVTFGQDRLDGVPYLAAVRIDHVLYNLQLVYHVHSS